MECAMRVLFKSKILVLAPETDSERDALAVWRASSAGHVFHFGGESGDGGALFDLGPRAEACGEPINIVFDRIEPRWQPISNLAHTPFVLRSMPYASVEGFWQGLKFPLSEDRARVAELFGLEAKRAANGQPASESFVYDGETYAIGGPEHRALMAEACRAKFTQHAGAREALLSTGSRPLTHRTRRDSRTIPGVLMADIWMRLRQRLRNG
jgi:predicted NAD-dependent protein-ADP-ribosyltransferase YbiA (DUF1768 family)